MTRRYMVAAALVAGIAILIVEAYFIYGISGSGAVEERASSPLSSPPAGATDFDPTRTPEATEPEGKGGKDRPSEAGDDAFTLRATADNAVNNSAYIDNAATNQNPDAVLLVERASGPDGNWDYDHEIGVWYDGYRGGGRWAVFNQDRFRMLEGAAFDVVVLRGPGKLVHRATDEDTVNNFTYLNDDLTNGRPGAKLAVTQNWNPGGRGNTYNDHPVDVVYDEEVERWAILNEDGAAMPVGAAFNVSVTGGAG